MELADGFIKITNKQTLPHITTQQRVQLMRKVNELLNQKKFTEAEKICHAIHYSDGLVRIGDHYDNNNQPFKALEYYMNAGNARKIASLSKKIAQQIQRIIKN